MRAPISGAAGLILAGASLVFAACAPETTDDAVAAAGAVEILDPRMESLVEPGTELELLGEGYAWAEGPVWITEGAFLLFTDVPGNTIHAWSEGLGAEPWLTPSGYTGIVAGGTQGANGLTLDPDGYLVMAQHGDRRVARLEFPLWDPEPRFTTIADSFGTGRFNSPNDLAYRSDGSLWFTDPPYGLDGGDDSPDKDLAWNGVYVLRADGNLELVVDSLTRPNGIAFSPDERTLYVANSDPQRAWWVAYSVSDDGQVGEGRLLFDATALVPERPGLPDGLKVDLQGNLFATGPGGVLVLAPNGEHLGTIRTEAATANVAFGGPEGRTLFLTNSSTLRRIPLRTRGPIAPVPEGTS